MIFPSRLTFHQHLYFIAKWLAEEIERNARREK